MGEPDTLFTSRMMKRKPLVYWLLLVVWCVVIAWQVIEHDRVTTSARAALKNRSRAIASTLSLVIRSQRRFGVVRQENLESALKELVASGDGPMSLALLNASNEVLIAAGQPIQELEKTGATQEAERWDSGSVTLVNSIDLGAPRVTPEGETNPSTVVLPPRDLTAAPRNPPPGGPRPETEPPERRATNLLGGVTTNQTEPDRPPPPREARRQGRPPDRPFWLTAAEWQSMKEKRNLHGLVMVMSTEPLRAARIEDFWLRCIICAFAGISMVGVGLAWQNLLKLSGLQLRLVRASELNSHLKEMNLAAAGLAHETRNPLNIIRGLAHMISKEPAVSAGIQQRSREITDEVDRVTGQLNEFINYSRPREVRRSPVVLNAVIGDVVRALQSDVEDKLIRLTTDDAGLTISADEKLLRQVLFNLLLNGIQAVERGGEIQVVCQKSGSTEAWLEIRDNGPGVPAEHRQEIFKPYFTTTQKGTGLGLAVVQQIVLAHGWEIECLPNDPKGAIFRLSRLPLSIKA